MINSIMKRGFLASVWAGVLILPIGAWAEQRPYSMELLESSQVVGSANADYNNDGHEDIFLTGHDNNDRIWYWTKNGYVPSPQRLKDSEPGYIDRHDCASADVNLDGMLDFYCSVGARRGFGEGPNQLWIQGPMGVHTKVFGHGAEDRFGRGRWVEFFNFNGDAYPDLFVTNTPLGRDDDEENVNQVFVNNGDSTFSAVKTVAKGAFGSECLSAGDINSDGWGDIVICNEWGDRVAHIYLNNQRGNFELLPNPGSGRFKRAKLADLNKDGFSDLLLISYEGLLEVYLNTGKKGSYFGKPLVSQKFNGEPIDLAIGDFNRDGHKDIYVVLRQPNCEKAAGNMVDTAPDVVYFGDGKGGLKRRELPYAQMEGCGGGAETVAGDQVILIHKTSEVDGKSMLLQLQPK